MPRRLGRTAHGAALEQAWLWHGRVDDNLAVRPTIGGIRRIAHDHSRSEWACRSPRSLRRLRGKWTALNLFKARKRTGCAARGSRYQALRLTTWAEISADCAALMRALRVR